MIARREVGVFRRGATAWKEPCETIMRARSFFLFLFRKSLHVLGFGLSLVVLERATFFRPIVSDLFKIEWVGSLELEPK